VRAVRHLRLPAGPLATRGERAYHGFVPGIAAMPDPLRGGNTMAKKSSADGVYRVTEVIGTSKVSWEDAAKNAVTAASKTLRDLRIAEVSKLDMKVEDGKVVAYRARVQLSFKYDG
jgi:flavin-binding protein dodecin